MKWRIQYQDPQRDQELGDLTATTFDPSEDKALQQYKDEVNINTMLRRFGQGQEISRPIMEPFYGDFSEATDYQSALNLVLAADEAFDALPSKIRRRFRNQPAELLRFLQDPANAEEAAELGLIGSFRVGEPVLEEPEPKPKAKKKKAEPEPDEEA